MHKWLVALTACLSWERPGKVSTFHMNRDGDWSQVLVFTRTKHGANRLTKQLLQDGINASAIHGNKSQAARLLGLTRNALRYRLAQMGIE